MGVNIIESTFSASLEEAGFRKKGGSWYLDTEDCVLVANLQKSSFGELYYVNLAVWLKGLGAKLFPKEHECHVRMRATNLARDDAHFLEHEVFNLTDSNVSEPKRRESIREFLEEVAIPTLVNWGSLEGLRSAEQDGSLAGAAVLLSAKSLLQF